MKDIFKQIRDERADFLQNEIEVVPGYNFSQYNTIKKIHLYHNSQYEKGNYEVVNGVRRKKVFHNISSWRCEVATKMIDIDVKDFVLSSENPATDWNVYLLEKELKAWLKKSEFGELLNEISEQLPVYGSCVLEKTSDGASLVDLRYLYNDQSVECLDDGYVNIKYLLSHKDLRKMAKKGWDNVQFAIDNFSGEYKTGYDTNGIQTAGEGSNLFYEGAGAKQSKPNGSPLVEVWVRYGEVPLSWFTEKESDDNEYVLAKFVVAGVDKPVKNDDGVVLAEDGVVLWKEQIEEVPLKEVHYTRTKGRWLGVGIVEMLFENQRRINEIKDNESIAVLFGATQVFQTRDGTVASNILTDLSNGDILQVKSEITPIATESRNITAFRDISDSIEQHSDNLTFSRDVVSGENAPASATLGAVQIQTQQTTAVFDYKKENIALFLEDFIKELVYPQIEKELTKEHVLKITGDYSEIQKLRNNFSISYANKKMVEAILNDNEGKFEPTQQVYDLFKQKGLEEISLMGDKIWTTIEKDFFDNIEYNVNLEITGEGKNVYAQIQNGSSLLAVISKDPTILQDPAKRKILFKIMSGMGWHTSDLEGLETQPQQMQQQIQQMVQQNPQQIQPQMA